MTNVKECFFINIVVAGSVVIVVCSCYDYCCCFSIIPSFDNLFFINIISISICNSFFLNRVMWMDCKQTGDYINNDEI